MNLFDTLIVLLASFVGTGLVIRLIKEYIKMGREIEEEKKKEDHK